MPDRVQPSLTIFDIRTLWRPALFTPSWIFENRDFRHSTATAVGFCVFVENFAQIGHSVVELYPKMHFQYGVRPRAFYAEWWMQAASKSEQWGTQGGFWSQICYATPHYNMTNKTITNNKLLSFKSPLSLPWLVRYFHHSSASWQNDIICLSRLCFTYWFQWFANVGHIFGVYSDSV